MCYSCLLRAVVPIAANRAIGSSKKKRNSQLHSIPLHSEISSCGRPFGPCVWLKRSRILYGELAVMPCPQRRSLQGELSLLTQSVTGVVLLLKTLCMLCGLAQRLTSCGLISPCGSFAGLQILRTSKCWCHG